MAYIYDWRGLYTLRTCSWFDGSFVLCTKCIYAYMARWCVSVWKTIYAQWAASFPAPQPVKIDYRAAISDRIYGVDTGCALYARAVRGHFVISRSTFVGHFALFLFNVYIIGCCSNSVWVLAWVLYAQSYTIDQLRRVDIMCVFRECTFCWKLKLLGGMSILIIFHLSTLNDYFFWINSKILSDWLKSSKQQRFFFFFLRIKQI